MQTLKLEHQKEELDSRKTPKCRTVAHQVHYGEPNYQRRLSGTTAQLGSLPIMALMVSRAGLEGAN